MPAPESTVSIHEAITEVETGALAEFALEQDVAARCNQAAAIAGHLDLTVPSFDQLTAYMESPDHVILVAEKGGQLVGYAVVRDTGRIRWLVLADHLASGPGVGVVRAIATEVRTRYGVCYGRISNRGLRHVILARVPESRERASDPEVLEWV